LLVAGDSKSIVKVRDGVITEIKVDFNSRVKAGDIVAQIDPAVNLPLKRRYVAMRSSMYDTLPQLPGRIHHKKRGIPPRHAALFQHYSSK
jgi:hypothetical protein